MIMNLFEYLFIFEVEFFDIWIQKKLDTYHFGKLILVVKKL